MVRLLVGSGLRWGAGYRIGFVVGAIASRKEWAFVLLVVTGSGKTIPGGGVQGQRV